MTTKTTKQNASAVTDARKLHFQDPVRFTQRTLVGGEFRIAKSYCGGDERRVTINLRKVTCLNCLNRLAFLTAKARRRVEEGKLPVIEPSLFERAED